jgi:hypothetical protein
MGDGRSCTSPNLVYPGWVLRLPTRTSTSGPSTTPHATTPAPGSSPAPTPDPTSTPFTAPTGRTSPASPRRPGPPHPRSRLVGPSRRPRLWPPRIPRRKAPRAPAPGGAIPHPMNEAPSRIAGGFRPPRPSSPPPWPPCWPPASPSLGSSTGGAGGPASRRPRCRKARSPVRLPPPGRRRRWISSERPAPGSWQRGAKPSIRPEDSRRAGGA